MANQYKKLSDGTWGAFIDCGFGRNARPHPQVGDTVKLTTKSGETHQRVIAKIVTTYKSGVTVAFAADAAIAAQAQARYDAAKAARQTAEVNQTAAARPSTTPAATETRVGMRPDWRDDGTMAHIEPYYGMLGVADGIRAYR